MIPDWLFPFFVVAALLVGVCLGIGAAHAHTMAKVCGAIAAALGRFSNRDETEDFFRGCRVLAEEIEQEFIAGIPAFRKLYDHTLKPLKRGGPDD